MLPLPHSSMGTLMSKWRRLTYLSRTVPGIGHLLKPLDEALRSVLLPALTGRPPPGDQERTLFALPARLGVGIPSTNATFTRSVPHHLLLLLKTMNMAMTLQL